MQEPNREILVMSGLPGRKEGRPTIRTWHEKGLAMMRYIRDYGGGPEPRMQQAAIMNAVRFAEVQEPNGRWSLFVVYKKDLVDYSARFHINGRWE